MKYSMEATVETLLVDSSCLQVLPLTGINDLSVGGNRLVFALTVSVFCFLYINIFVAGRYVIGLLSILAKLNAM